MQNLNLKKKYDSKKLDLQAEDNLPPQNCTKPRFVKMCGSLDTFLNSYRTS